MAWNDTPPTKEELAAAGSSGSWDAAPPTDDELKALAGPTEDSRDLIPSLKAQASGVWGAAKRGASDVADIVTHPARSAGEAWDTVKDVATDPLGDLQGVARAARSVPVVGDIAERGAAAAMGIGAGVKAKLSGEDFEPAYLKEFNENLANDKAGDEKHAKDSPRADTLQRLAGASQVMNPAAIGFDAYMKSLRAGNSPEDAMRDARNAATFQGAVLGGGKAAVGGLKGAGKLLPATEGSVTNSVAAKLGGLLPGASSADDIKAVYSDPALRRQARGYRATEAAEELKPQVEAAEGKLKDAVGSKFGELEKESLQQTSPANAEAVKPIADSIEAIGKQVEANSDFYAPVTKTALQKVSKTLSTGGLEEYGTATAGTPLSADNIQARTLNARRVIDDVTKNRDFDKFHASDRDMILKMRDALDTPLKEQMAGSPLRNQADTLYRDYAPAAKNVFKPLSAKTPGGERITDVVKIESNLKSQNGRGANFDARLEGLQKFMDAHGEEIGSIPEVQQALDALKNSREVASMTSKLGNLQRSGGPTGSAVHGVGHVGLAAVTHGASIPFQLMLMPITDPAAYAKLVDTLSPATRAAVQAGAKAIMGSSEAARALARMRVQNTVEQDQ